jgi:hypothetical protein
MTPLPSLELSFPQAQQSIALQCDSALQMVIEAQEAGVLDAPAISLSDFEPETEREIKLADLNPVRFHTIAKQLWLLGYITEKPRSNISPQHQKSEEFRTQLSRFQKDAGITQDGWIGEKTWKTLQELISFESPIDPKTWLLPNGTYRTAFNRALQLRMWVYGFIENKPTFNFAGLQKQTLLETSRILNIAHNEQQHHQSDWRCILLDADLMLAGAINAIASADLLAEADKVRIRRLLIATARVELWLLGLDVWVSNADNYKVENYGVKRVKRRRGSRTVRTNETNLELKKGLRQFWSKLMGRSEDQAKDLSKQLSLSFFKALQQPQSASAQTDLFDEPDFSRQAAEKLNTTQDIEKGYSRYRNLGMKLWDGIKRIWRWFVKGIKNIIKLADNLIRGFFRLATKSYIILRTALISLTSATAQYVKGKVAQTGKHTVLIDKDFDYTTILHNKENQYTATRAINHFSAQFSFSCKVVGLIVSFLTKATQGIIGWARFLHVLVANYRDIAFAYAELKLFKQTHA